MASRLTSMPAASSMASGLPSMPADPRPSTSKSENTLLKSNEMFATQSSGSSIPDWLMKKLVSTNNAAPPPRKQRAPVTPPTTQIPLYPTSMNVQRPGGQLASFGMLSPHYYTRAPQFIPGFMLLFYFPFFFSCCPSMCRYVMGSE